MNPATLMDFSFFLIVLYTGLLCSLVLVPFSKKLALATGLLDHPDPRKMHSQSMPRLGGLGIAGAVLITVVLCIKLAPPVVAFLLGAAIVVFTGLLDDLVSIPPPLKFVGQGLAALVFVGGGGGELTTLGNLVGVGDIQLGPLALLFSVVAMTGVMNAVNLSDGLDGLAGGISSIALVFFGLLAYTHQAWFSLAIILAVLGAVLGFLRYNAHPAKLFMGDTGSLFLGFTLAALAVRLATGNVGSGPVKPIVLAVILALPIADTLWVMGNRSRQGKNPFQPDKTHLHHRLMHLGLQHAKVVPVIYGVMFLCGCLGWLGRDWPEWCLFGLALFFLIALYAGIQWCEQHRVNLGRLLAIKNNHSPKNREAEKRFLRAMGRSARIVFPVFVFFFFLPVFSTGSPPQTFGFFALALALFILLLYPWAGGRQEMPLAHGIFFAATFAMILGLWTTQPQPVWLTVHGNIVSLFALLWVAPQFLWGRMARSLLPGSFELILILLVFFVPLILVPALGGTEEQQKRVAWACIQAVPIIILLKLTVKRHARRNRLLAASFVVTLAGIGLLSLLS